MLPPLVPAKTKGYTYSQHIKPRMAHAKLAVSTSQPSRANYEFKNGYSRVMCESGTMCCGKEVIQIVQTVSARII